MQINPIILLTGAGLAITGLYNLYQLKKRNKMIEDSKSWPNTSGTVINSAIKSRSSKSGKKYSVEITYKYSVLGLSKSATRKINCNSLGKEAATEHVNAHPNGSIFVVRYNPNKYQEHVVDFEEVTRNDFLGAILTLIFGIIFLIGSTFPSGP
jgi:hypothetical protein